MTISVYGCISYHPHHPVPFIAQKASGLWANTAAVLTLSRNPCGTPYAVAVLDMHYEHQYHASLKQFKVTCHKVCGHHLLKPTWSLPSIGLLRLYLFIYLFICLLVYLLFILFTLYLFSLIWCISMLPMYR